jgi:hypothetical protein
VNEDPNSEGGIVTDEKWSIECDYMESCNCDFGCACNFSGFPNYGRCEALVGYHIRSGNYGNVSLDGLDFIYAASWPRAIHQGNGTMRVYIADRAFDEQRNAIAEIAYGRAKGNGPFALFAATLRYVLDPEFVPIEMRVDGKRSRLSIHPNATNKGGRFSNEPKSQDELERQASRRGGRRHFQVAIEWT